jgi:hypothetical protein
MMTDRRVGKSVTIGDLVIEPIEQIVVRVEQIGSRIVGLALKWPVSVVIRSPAGTFRLDLEGAESTGDGWPG